MNSRTWSSAMMTMTMPRSASIATTRVRAAGGRSTRDVVACICQSRDRAGEVALAHQHIVGVVGREREDADARCGERFRHAEQNTGQSEVEQPGDRQGAPSAPLSHL